MSGILLYKIKRLLARLRSHQPALLLLPGLIAGQILATKIGSIYCLLIIFACLLLLVKSKNFLALSCGVSLGLLSALLPLNVEYGAENFEMSVLARLEPQGLRYPKAGLMQFALELVDIHGFGENLNHKYSKLQGSRFICKTIILPWKNISKISPGQLLIAKGSFKIFPKNLWPWEFESGLRRRGYVGSCKIKYFAPISNRKTSTMSEFRETLLSRYYRSAGKDELSALILSLSLGVRDGISTSSERLFKDLGISHVLVLSGMQVGLVFFSAAFLLRKILRPVIPKNPSAITFIAYFLASLLAALLVNLTNYEASAARAWIACVLVAWANCKERDAGIMRGTIASFLVLSLIWPGCWAEPGVQLSFAALFGIAVGQDLSDSKADTFILPCMLATLFTASISAAWFEEISVSALIANYIVAPWFGVLGCYLGFFLIFACYFEIPFVDEIAMLSRWLLSNCLSLVENIHVYLPGPGMLRVGQCLLIILMLLLFCCWYLFFKARKWGREYNIFSRST